jgi:hypothetical protein
MLGSLALLTAIVASGSFSDAVDLDFSSQGYDRTLFRPNVRRSLGRWEVADGKLRAEIPRGTAARPPINFASLFGMEGDFEVVVEYQIVNLPKPRESPKPKGGDAVNSIEIVLSGESGWCGGSRKATPAGDRVSSYAELDAGREKVASDLLPVSGNVGRLEARRRGDTICFYHAEAGGAAVEIGSVPFGKGPVAEVGLQVYAMNTADPVDVRFSSIHVGAGRLTGGFRGTSWARRIVTWGLGIAAVALGVFALRRLAGARMGATGSRRGAGLAGLGLLAIAALAGSLADRPASPDGRDGSPLVSISPSTDRPEVTA